MKGYTLEGLTVYRQGVAIAYTQSDGELKAAEGQGRYLSVAKRFLKTFETSDKRGKPLVDVFREEAEEKIPDTMTVGEIAIPVTKDMEVVKPHKRIFELPAGAKIEHPPRDKVAPEHKATLYFTKNGFARKLAVMYVPTDEQALELIEGFNM